LLIKHLAFVSPFRGEIPARLRGGINFNTFNTFESRSQSQFPEVAEAKNTQARDHRD
jgi:hypothetical protein